MFGLRPATRVKPNRPVSSTGARVGCSHRGHSNGEDGDRNVVSSARERILPQSMGCRLRSRPLASVRREMIGKQCRWLVAGNPGRVPA